VAGRRGAPTYCIAVVETVAHDVVAQARMIDAAYPRIVRTSTVMSSFFKHRERSVR
jgi:hypothetical protein